jgi:hypothetical protein
MQHHSNETYEAASESLYSPWLLVPATVQIK